MRTSLAAASCARIASLLQKAAGVNAAFTRVWMFAAQA
jgi:hypothetical protein